MRCEGIHFFGEMRHSHFSPTIKSEPCTVAVCWAGSSSRQQEAAENQISTVDKDWMYPVNLDKCGLNKNLTADLGSPHLFSWSYLEELSIHRCAVWLTKHAGKCFCQWQSLPDPEVLMTLSRPKPSGKSNGCFCQVLKSKCFMTPEERKRTRRGDDLPSGHKSIFIQSKSNRKEQRTINSDQLLLIFQRVNWIKHNKVVLVLLTFGIVSSLAMTHRYEIHEHFAFMLVNLLEKCDSTDKWKSPLLW